MFGDESGDSGFKFPPLYPPGGSSFYFTTAVISTYDAINLTALVDSYRASLHWPTYREFKFSNMDDDQRTAFLEFARGLTFEARVLVTHKRPLLLASAREGFYERMLRDGLLHGCGSARDAIVMWDESVKATLVKKRVKTYLRQQLNTDAHHPMIHEMRFGRSHSHSMLQLADMVASSVQRAYENGNDHFSRIIAKRICVHSR